MVLGVEPSCHDNLVNYIMVFPIVACVFFFRTCNNVLNPIMVTTLGISRVLFIEVLPEECLVQ